MRWKLSRGATIFVAVGVAIPIGLTLFFGGAKVLDSTSRSIREVDERRTREREQSERDARVVEQRHEAQRVAAENAQVTASTQASGMAATGWDGMSIEQIAAVVSSRRCAVLADRSMPFSRIGSHLARIACITFAVKPAGALDAAPGRFLALGMEGKRGDVDGFDRWSMAYDHEAPVLQISKGSTSTDDMYGMSAVVIRGPANALVCRGSAAWLVIDPDSTVAASPDQMAGIKARVDADAGRRDARIYDMLRSRALHVGRYNGRTTYRLPWLLAGTSMGDRHRLVMRMAFPEAVASITVHGAVENGELHLTPSPGQDLRGVPITEAGLSLSLDGTRDGLGGMMVSDAGPRRCWVPYDRESATVHAVDEWVGIWSGTITGANGEVPARLELALDDAWQGNGSIIQGSTTMPLALMLAVDTVWCRRTDQAASAPFQLRRERSADGARMLLVGAGSLGRMAMERVSVRPAGRAESGTTAP